MKHLAIMISVVLIFTFQFSFAKTNELLKVNYINGKILLINGNLFELSDGSIWSTPKIEPVRSGSKIIIIVDAQLKNGIAFVRGEKISVKHISGNFPMYSGFYSKVISEMNEGAVLFTEDGSDWSVPDYERKSSMQWRPPYNVLITSDKLFLMNLDKNKRIIIFQRNY